jgi:hypothetical protein
MKVRKEQLDAVSSAIDELFYSTKARLLGKFFEGPKIWFEVAYTADPLQTIEGLFRYTLQLMFPSARPDEKMIETLAHITGNYLDARRLQTKNQILTDLISAKTKKEADKAVADRISEASTYIETLVNNESRIAQAYAEREGIHQVAAGMGVDDPVVAKLGIIDDRMCKNCRKLWHTEGNIKVPKVYKMSELQEGYMKDWRNPTPTIGPTHPNCRCVLTFVPPNFGFDQAGNITFKGLGWDEWEFQNGDQVRKFEPNVASEDNFFDLHEECSGHHGT